MNLQGRSMSLWLASFCSFLFAAILYVFALDVFDENWVSPKQRSLVHSFASSGSCRSGVGSNMVERKSGGSNVLPDGTDV
jgi:hypothetical protein